MNRAHVILSVCFDFEIFASRYPQSNIFLFWFPCPQVSTLLDARQSAPQSALLCLWSFFHHHQSALGEAVSVFLHPTLREQKKSLDSFDLKIPYKRQKWTSL